MSKRNVQRLLVKILRESATKNQRLRAELLTHEFTIDKDDILNEIKDQIKGINVKTKDKISIFISPQEESIIEKSVQKYYNSITKYFKKEAEKNTKYKITCVSFGTTKIVVTVEPLSNQNVFSYIKNARKPFLDILRTEIMNLLQTGYDKVDNTLAQRIQGNFTDKTKTERGGGTVQLGHGPGSSIAERRGKSYVMTVQGWSNQATASRTGQLDPILKLEAIINSNSNLRALKTLTLTSVIQIKDQGQNINASQGAGYERSLMNDIKDAIDKVLSEEDWTNFKSSPSPIEMVIGEIHKQAKKSKFTKFNAKAIQNTGKSSTTAKESSKPKTKKVVGVSAKDIYANSVKVDIKPPPKRREATSQNWLSFVNIINAKLADRVKGNMISPKLVNRTGRFAESAKVTTVETTPEGFPSFVFDYQRNPYEVFDRVNGRSPWNTPNRDPKSLVALSIREIAQELAIGRFYTRRA